MTDNANTFEPKIIAYVCNWCTYLGADLAGTTRLEYPPNVRLIRLPCTGRIDFNLLVKAFEVGADAVLVSGCHPGDCHYTAGNYHARRRWILFRELLSTLGFELERIHFSWISAAEGRKWQQVITDITDKTRKLGPYKNLYAVGGDGKEILGDSRCEKERPAVQGFAAAEPLRQAARRVLEEGKARVVIGYGERSPVFVSQPEQVDRLAWNSLCNVNLVVYLKKKEVRALGKPAIVVKGCDERALVALEQENQLSRQDYYSIGMACDGMGEARCQACDVRKPRFADEIVGQPAETTEAPKGRGQALDALLAAFPAERMDYWAGEFSRCMKCYACRQACPLCYCERCIADKNRPIAIDTSPTLKGNFAWHITRAFHLAGRCVGCDACTRACPAGIDLSLLNLSVARAAESHFGVRAGTDPRAEPLIGSFSLQDKENFIL